MYINSSTEIIHQFCDQAGISSTPAVMAVQMMILAFLALRILAAEALVQGYETVGKFIMYTKVSPWHSGAIPVYIVIITKVCDKDSTL